MGKVRARTAYYYSLVPLLSTGAYYPPHLEKVGVEAGRPSDDAMLAHGRTRVHARLVRVRVRARTRVRVRARVRVRVRLGLEG